MPVSSRAAHTGMWPQEAAAAIALKLTKERGDNRWEPAGAPRVRS